MFWRHGIKFKDGKQTIRTTNVEVNVLKLLATSTVHITVYCYKYRPYTGTLHEDRDTDSEDELAIQNSDTEDKKTNESAPDRQKALHI